MYTIVLLLSKTIFIFFFSSFEMKVLKPKAERQIKSNTKDRLQFQDSKIGKKSPKVIENSDNTAKSLQELRAMNSLLV